MTEIPTSEVLNRAADLIEERGWEAGGGWGIAGDKGLCLEGGILAAMGLDAFGLTHVNECPAGRAVRDYLDMTPEVSSDGRSWMDLSDLQHMRFWTESAPLYKWNDSPKRTADEVIEVLRACAVIEASREREAAEVSA